MKLQSSPLKDPATPVARRRYWQNALWLALLLLVTFAVYLPAMNGGRLWDDEAHITQPALQSVGGLYRIWFELDATQQYYPLLHSTFWLEHKLWGDSMLGYHLVNMMWHLMAVSLVYLILTRLKIPGALLAAAIFALHPVMVESVAWISEQKNTLSAVFYLSAMLSYIVFDESRKRTFYLLALVLFVLGLLNKTVTATLPPALLVIFWWQRGKLSWRRDVWPLLPFFMMGAAAGLLTSWVEWKLIGAEGADFELSFVARCLLAGRVVFFYLAKLIWPANLTFIYPRWTVDAGQGWQWLFPLAVLAATLALWAIRRRWRGPLAGWLFFCGTLFPVLGFLNVFPFIYSFVADHFQYLASLGMIVLAAAGITRLLTRQSPPLQRVWSAFTLLLVGTLAVLSWRQSHMYADSITLYQTTIDRNPACWMAHNNLAMTFSGLGNQQAAIEHLQTAFRIKPDHAASRNNLGLVMANMGRMQEAMELYREALRLKPNYSDAHLNLGNALMNSGQLPEAIEEYHTAISLQPNDPRSYNNLGIALIRTARATEALEHIEYALQLDSNYADARNNLGLAYTQMGEAQKAIEQFKQNLASNPNDVNAHNNLGILYAGAGDAAESIAHFEQAARLRPDLADVQNSLGEMLRQTGRPHEAIEHYQAALRLQPDFAPAYANLARAFAAVDRPEDAVATAQRAIEAARSAGDQSKAEQAAEWLSHYQKELSRSRETELESSSTSISQ